MLLIVSSQTVAAETCTPCADVMACRAFGPSRGLSSSIHSRAWLSRSSITVEHLLDVGVYVERVVCVGDLALETAERHVSRVVGYEVRDRLARLGDHYALTGGDLLKQSRQVRLGLVDVHRRRHASMIRLDLV